MNEMSDQELDALFRKSAEEIEIPFDPEAWQRMEQKLDDNGHRNGWLRWGLLGGLLLLIGTGIYLLPQRQGGLALPKDTILASGDANAKTNGNMMAKPQESDLNNAGNTVQSRKKTVNTGNKKMESNIFPVSGQDLKNTGNPVGLAANNRKKRPMPGNGNTIEKLAGRSEVTGESKQLALGLNKPGETAENGVRKNSSLSGENDKAVGKKKLRRFEQASNEKDGRRTGLLKSVTDVGEGAATKKKPHHETPNGYQVDNDAETREYQEKQPANRQNTELAAKNRTLILSGEKAAVSLTPSADKKQPESNHLEIEVDNGTDSYVSRLGLLAGKTITPGTGAMPRLNYVFALPAVPASPLIRPSGKTLHGGSRIGLRVVAAPDLTTVGFRDFTKPSTSAGLLLEYAISDRWLISAGGMYTRKLYAARGSDYKPVGSYWTNRQGIYLNTVAADCRIIDIPLNVRYNAIQRTKGNWFASAGLSSYLMKNEDYDYEYYENNQLKNRSWNVRNSDNHLFAIGNLSGGYERNVNRRFSWQIEPFVKVPLGGVGFGRVRLISSGVFFSVRYRPLMPK